LFKFMAKRRPQPGWEILMEKGVQIRPKLPAGMRVPIPRDDVSFNWPSDRIDDHIKSIARGDLYPEIATTGDNGSSLMAALAVAISSARRTRDAKKLFRDLNNANNNDMASRTDSPRHAEGRLRIMARDFIVPALGEVMIRPLLATGRQARTPTPSQAMPLTQVQETINKGGAVIMPLPKGQVPGLPKGRVSWGAVTGYEERVSAREADTPGPATDTEFAFTLAVPQPDLETIILIGAEKFDEWLGPATYAHKVSPLPGTPVN
jgi:hypothetical protein